MVLTHKLQLEDMIKLIYSVDDYDYSNSSKFKNPAKECPACHKIFHSEARSVSLQHFCRRSHYVDCVICGEPVLQKNLSFCSSEIKCACLGECSKKSRAMQVKQVVRR